MLLSVGLLLSAYCHSQYAHSNDDLVVCRLEIFAYLSLPVRTHDLVCRLALPLVVTASGHTAMSNLVNCRLEKFQLLSQPVRTQLFRHLENQASLMLAFHYAHTDAVQSMLHFDLQPQQGHSATEAPSGPAIANGDNTALIAASTTVVAKEQVIQQVCDHVAASSVLMGSNL